MLPTKAPDAVITIGVMGVGSTTIRDWESHCRGVRPAVIKFMTVFQPTADTICRKSAALSDAPPIKPPSISGCASKMAALAAFMLPP